MSLWKLVVATLAIQLAIAQEICPGLRLSAGLGALLGDLPLSTSQPTLPTLPIYDSCETPDLSMPTLPSLSSGDCMGLPSLPAPPCEPTLLPLPATVRPPCLFKRNSLLRKRRCGCKESLLLGGEPQCEAPVLPTPIFPPQFCEPYPAYPLLKPKLGCLSALKNKLSASLLEKLVLKKGLALGVGPNYGVEMSCLPEAVSSFAAESFARPLEAGLYDDCCC